MQLFAGFVLAALIGLSLGLLGGGGSILTVPILIYVLGVGAKAAIAMSLPIVGLTSTIGAVRHWRAGSVDLRAALVFGGITMATSYLGARLAAFVPARAQLTILAVVMIAAAGSLLRKSRERPPATAVDDDVPVRRFSALLAVIAAGVGLLTGLIGIGGGFLVVPALVLLAGLTMRAAIGTSLVVIAMNSLSGSLGYIGQADISWSFVAVFSSIAVLGILIGTHLVRFVSQVALKQAFAVLLLVTGGLMLFGNHSTRI